MDCFGTLFKTHRAAYLPVFEQHLFDRVMHVRHCPPPSLYPLAHVAC